MPVANGIVRGWLDGLLVYEKTDAVLRQHPAIKIDDVWLDHTHGNPGSAEAGHVRDGGTRVANAYVGPMNDIGSPPAQVPSAPTGMTASAGNAQATVTFTPPSDGGSPITGYAVTSNPAGGVDADAGTLSTTRTITGLVNGTAYTFTVTATNAIGSSPPRRRPTASRQSLP